MRTVGVRLMADVSQYTRNMGTAARSTREFGGELDRAARAGNLDAVTDQAAGLGLGLLGAAAVAVKFGMDFDKQMSNVKAATRASADQMGLLRQAALDAGADTSFSATEAAKGITELSKAGVSTTDVLGGGLKGALDLAAAGELDVGEAAETAASAMTQFKLKGTDVPHIADLLAAAAGKAQGTVHDMAAALNQAGLVSAQMGLSVEDTTGTLAAFASAGLTGSDAGTSLKTSMLMLANPTEKSKELMQQLGIQTYNASGQFIGITKLAGQLKDRLGGLTQEQRNAALAQIFGSDAIRAASILYEQGASGIQTWIDKTNDAGYASETAATKTDNLAGDIERLTGSVQTLAIESGSGANGGLRVLVKSLGAMVDGFGQLPPMVGSTITVLAAAGGAALLLGAGWMKLRRGTADMLVELRDVSPTGARAATALENTSKWAGRAGVAFVALQAGGALVSSFMKDLNPQIEAAAGGLVKWNRQADLAGEAARLFGEDGDELSRSLAALGGNGFSQATDGVTDFIFGLGGVSSPLDAAKEKTAAFDQALTAMVAKGSAQQAGAIVAEMAKRANISVKKLTELLPTYAGAVETASRSTTTAAGSVKTLGGAAVRTEEEIKALEDAFNKLFGVEMSLDRATIKYTAGIQTLAKELKTGTRSTSENTDQGRKNRSAVLDQIEAINSLRGARIGHGATLDDANRKYVRDIDGLRKSMRQAGFTQKQIEELTGAYRRVPGATNTKVAAPGAVVAKKQVDSFNFVAKAIPKSANTHVTVTGARAASLSLSQLVVMQQALKKGISMGTARALAGDTASAKDRGLFAAGGQVRGPGSNTSDDIPIWVSDEEWVVNARSAKKLGPRVMEHINTYGELPMFAGGGAVTWPFPTTAAGTRIPTNAEARSAVAPSVPSGGGATAPFIVAALHAAFPGLRIISTYRPGARTLSGNASYHGLNRAVDTEPSREAARWWNANYMARTKEFISPYQEYNINNGRRWRATGAVWNQHNFAGGNAHNHIAMMNGGVIDEPVFGYGASGRSYSFGEAGPERVIPGSAGARGGGALAVQISFSGPVGSRRELETWLVGAVDTLKRKGRF